MKFRNKQFSIKMRMLFFTSIVFLFVTIIIILTNFSNVKLVKTYNDFSESYNQLSLFYDNLQAGSEHIQSYFYLSKANDYRRYEYSVNSALKNINYLKVDVSEELYFRCELLENMLVNYKKQVDEIRVNDFSNVQLAEKYDDLVHLHTLIDSTSVEYFNYITDDMQLKKRDIISSLKQQIEFAIILLITILIASILFSSFLIKSITKPIEQIVKNINKIKVGQFNISEVKNGSKEINILLQAFDEMAVGLKQYVTSIKEKAELKQQLLIKENENLRINKTLTLSKLKTLQSQINPHFLFNTLNMISKSAYLEGAQKTSDLMVITSDLLRYGLDKSDTVSDLIQEIECVQNYLRIQKIRFGDRIKFEIIIDENIPRIKIPGMIIQPLIENSITHGVKDIVSDARVALVVQVNGNEIIIKIEDNGKGMNADEIERLTINTDSIEDFDEFAESTSIGIYNVRRRLEMFYGNQQKFSIESSKDCGVTVVIRINISNGEDGGFNV